MKNGFLSSGQVIEYRVPLHIITKTNNNTTRMRRFTTSFYAKASVHVYTKGGVRGYSGDQLIHS
jgi:hypothetical protein